MATPWEKYQTSAAPSAPATKPWERRQAQAQPSADYADVLRAAKAEIDRLNAAQTAAGRETLSAGAQTALTDQYRQQAGFDPRLPQMDELNRVNYGAAEEASQGPVADFLTAPAQSVTGIGTGVVGLFSPETARRMQENQAAYYGTGGQNKASRFYGGTIGGAANVIAAAPAGVVGMAGLYGASGAGSTRTDIAERRTQGEEISGQEEAIASTLIGGAEGLSGLITGGILNRAKGLLGGVAGGTVTREAGAQGLRALVKRELPDLVTEVGEEMATQLFTNAVRKNTYAEDQQIGEGVLEAGLMSVLPILQAKGIARRMEPARQEQQQRQAARRGEVQPTPQGPMQPQFEAGPGIETGETSGSALPMTAGEMVGPQTQQAVDVGMIEGSAPTVDAEPNLNDPALRAYMDGLTGPTFDSQVGRRPAVAGETVGLDVRSEVEASQIQQPAPMTKPQAERTPAEKDIQDAVDAQTRFPGRLENPQEVEQFFGTMEQDANVLASYTDEPLVLVDIPVADIPNQQLGFEGEIVPAKLDRVRKGDPRSQPPIMAIGMGRDNLFVPDGNHRVMIARERGDQSIKGYVPESTAAQRGYVAPGAQRQYQKTLEPDRPAGRDAGRDVEQEAIDAGVMRRPDPEPTLEQRQARLREVEQIIQQEAEQAEMENLLMDTEVETTGSGSAVRPGASSQMLVEPGDPGRQFGRGVKGNPVFPTTFDAPSAQQLQELAGLAEPGKFGKFWRKTKDLLRDPTTGAMGQIEGRKIESTGRTKLAALEARRAARELNKVAKELGLDINKDTDTQMMLEEALRNERVLDNPRLQEAVVKFRKAVDYSSQVLADTAKAAGLDPTTYEDNIGSYLQNVTTRSMEESRGILRTGAREFAPTKGYQKVKRDAYILWDGSRVLGKYKTPEAANNARAAFVKERKQALINEGAKRRGVTDADLNNRAAKGLRVEEPISAEQRRETESHDIRYLATKSVLDNTHNAGMIDLHVAAADQFGQQPPQGLKAADTKTWAEDQGLVPLPGKGVYHTLDIYVPKKVGERLEEYTHIPTGINEVLRRFIVQPWKAAMTVYNPATWGRNYIGSQIHATLDGSSVFDPRNWPAYSQAVIELARKERSPLIRRLIERGDLDSDYDAEQAKHVALRTSQSGNIIDATMGAASAVHRGMARGYSYGDNLAKVASVIVHQNRDGMHMDDAIVEMERSHPNYNRVARITKFARNNVFLGAPFVSYMDQSLRNMGRGFVRDGGVNPNVSRAALIITIPYMIDQLSRAALGVGEDEDELLGRESAAGYLLKTLAEPIVWNPFSANGRDPKDRVMRLNLRYVIPALHDFIPRMNNGSLQMPFGFLSGPVIDSILEQITGKERFSGYEFLNEDMTLSEQAKARASRLVQTFAPLPPEVKRGFARPRKAVQGQSEEPVANALLATLTGVDVKTPYVAEQEVRKMINAAIDGGEAGEALAMLELWNETYKPGSRAKLDPTRVISGYKSSLRSKRSNAVKKAGDALFLGQKREAQRIIDQYNKERGEIAPELTINDVEGAVSVEREKGRDY